MMMKLTKRLLLSVLFLLPLLVACKAQGGRLVPLNPDEEGETILAGQPQLVTFAQLQADPDAFRDRLIRVSGTLLKVPPPTCVPYSGPPIEWALIAEALRLDATGFERAISMLDDDLPMTVDGFFRLYEGALGCGKAAPDGSAWTLEVIKVVQPNPLVASGLQRGGTALGVTSPIAPVQPPEGTATPGSQMTAPVAATPEGSAGITPTGSAVTIPMASATPGSGTVTLTPIPTASFTPSATSRFTPTPASTPQLGTPTTTPTPTRTPTLAPGTTLTPSPTATIRQTPGLATPTPTPTIEGYPVLPTTTPSYP